MTRARIILFTCVAFAFVSLPVWMHAGEGEDLDAYRFRVDALW